MLLSSWCSFAKVVGRCDGSCGTNTCASCGGQVLTEQEEISALQGHLKDMLVVQMRIVEFPEAVKEVCLRPPKVAQMREQPGSRVR